MNPQPAAHPPLIIAGPILRRVTATELVIWLVTSKPVDMTLAVFLHDSQECLFSGKTREFSPQPVRIGEHAYVGVVHHVRDTAFPADTLLEYDLIFHTEAGDRSVTELLEWLVYPGQQRPVFVYKPQLDQVLHGSCRKPHYPSRDALLRLDEEMNDTVTSPEQRAAMLIMTGDQIYADDVGGPMLAAIIQAGARLGLYPETLEGAVVEDSEAMQRSELCYYRREELLPRKKETKTLRDRFFGGVRKPIFTAAAAHNHLVTLAEVAGMYVLTWSPVLWNLVDLGSAAIPETHRQRYEDERRVVEEFAAELHRTQRLLAHIPTYMIFDDHDITDDWNLTRGWEEVAYEHPFSRRIIGNALIGYFLFQGWGNNPAQFEGEFLDQVRNCFNEPGGRCQDELIGYLLDYDRWNFCLDTRPKVVVLDTRTSRWRSESSLSKPSGLMDWENLSDLQQELMNQPAVLLVSPAPIFGVKLIEVVQRIITFFGNPLVVDAENWMAHPGAANVILNIFRHRKTPQNFVILSGDVHYSFAYDVKLKYRDNSPDIWQITCSGCKNEFPHTLLHWFDLLNRWLYANHSPLNWFTKRRRMRILPRQPDHDSARQLVNESSIGRVRLNEAGEPVEISVLPASGGEVRFLPRS